MIVSLTKHFRDEILENQSANSLLSPRDFEKPAVGLA